MTTLARTLGLTVPVSGLSRKARRPRAGIWSSGPDFAATFDVDAILPRAEMVAIEADGVWERLDAWRRNF